MPRAPVRRQALAGQDFADPDEIAFATQVATAQLNAHARPWIWGRPQPKHRSYRRRRHDAPRGNEVPD
jgi:hypothetical protein